MFTVYIYPPQTRSSPDQRKLSTLAASKHPDLAADLNTRTRLTVTTDETCQAGSCPVMTSVNTKPGLAVIILLILSSYLSEYYSIAHNDIEDFFLIDSTLKTYFF